MEQKHATGIEGLDDILPGGLPRGHLYLIEGEPGTGKTTLALSFLTTGRHDETAALYVTLSETSAELQMIAESHELHLDNVELVELERDLARHAPENQYTVFDSTEVELGDTLKAIYSAAERVKPTRVVIDSLSELRLVTRDSLRFRREVLALKRFFSNLEATVLVLDDLSIDAHDRLVQSIAHGVIRLERVTTDFGAERRRLIVSKLRGSGFREGYHDYRIAKGGLHVFPRLIAAEHKPDKISGQIPNSSKNLNNLLGGGLERGTSTIMMGPSGVGKSTLAATFAAAAAENGDKVEILLFDESLRTYQMRNRALEIGLEPYIEAGTIRVRQIDPAEVSPGELTYIVRCAVEKFGAHCLIIDSINGMVQAMPGERTLLIQIHELLTYLGQLNVTTIMTLAHHGMVEGNSSQADLSYLADTLILFRFFEAFGEIKQAISVVKKRTGDHQRGLHEARFAPGGLAIGDQLKEFVGILTGAPRFVGLEGRLFDADRG